MYREEDFNDKLRVFSEYTHMNIDDIEDKNYREIALEILKDKRIMIEGDK